MTGKAKRFLLAFVGGIALFSVITGCSSNSPPLTKTEESNFKGGPMPEEARQIMQQKLKEAASKAPNGGPVGPGGPGGPASSGAGQ